MGYDAGLIRDEYDCNSPKCECAYFDQTVIGKQVFFYILTKQTHSGDVAVSSFSFNRMIKTSDERLMAYPTRNPYWDQNFVNGEYIIAYRFGPFLNQAVRNGLPEV